LCLGDLVAELLQYFNKIVKISKDIGRLVKIVACDARSVT